MPLVIALTAVTLTLTTSMAMLPAVLRDPAIRQPSSTPVHSKKADRWYLVRSPQGSWYLNGEPISATVLSRTLRGEDLPDGGIRFLPSGGRQASDVASDLAWLKATSIVPVRLQLEDVMP